MVLVGALSNPDLQDLFQSLTGYDWHEGRYVRGRVPAGNPDGRRKFGTVSGAIVHVLTRAQTDLRLKEIWVEVERLLGGAVSRHSIKSYLHRGTYGSKPIFERVRHGRYRLLRGEDFPSGR